MTKMAATSTVTARLAVLAAVGVIAVVVVLLVESGGGPPVPGMPATVAAGLGSHPTTVTLHGDALALTASPTVQQLATLEQMIARQSFVAEQYGPVSWFAAQFASIARRVAAHTSAREPRRDLLVRASATGGLDLGDQELTSTLLFGTGVNPVASIRWLVPDANAIRIFVRTRGSLSLTAIDRALNRLVNQAGLTAVQSVSTVG